MSATSAASILIRVKTAILVAGFAATIGGAGALTSAALDQCGAEMRDTAAAMNGLPDQPEPAGMSREQARQIARIRAMQRMQHTSGSQASYAD